MKHVTKLFFILLFVFVCNSNVMAVEFRATPDEFNVTVIKVEFYNSTGAIWETAGEGLWTFNITSVGPGDGCGGGGGDGKFGTPIAFSPGLYTLIRVTVSRTITVRGEAISGLDTYYTTSGTHAAINNAYQGGTQDFQVGKINTTTPSETTTVKVPMDAITAAPNLSLAADTDYFIFTASLGEPAQLGPGTSKRAKIYFDAENVLIFNTDNPGLEYCYLTAPGLWVVFR